MGGRWFFPVLAGFVTGVTGAYLPVRLLRLRDPQAILLLVLAGVIGAAMVTRYIRHRDTRIAASATGVNCGTCGYDLRASESRCPECGTFIPLPLERH